MRHRMAIIFLTGLLMAPAARVLAQPGGFEGFQSIQRNKGSAAGQPPALNDGLPPLLKEVGFDQRLDEPLPLDLTFVDETGKSVTLGDCFGRRPVVLALAYFECPMLCTQVLNGLASSMKGMNLDAGDDFDVITVSFDPEDKPGVAAARRDVVLQRYGRPVGETGWRFLTGDPEAIRRLTEAVGFRYVYDPKSDQFAHASGVVVLTRGGRISRYLFGVEYAPRDLRLALVEASENRIGNLVDQVMLFCYHYDPEAGKYGAVAIGSLRVGGALTLLALGTFFFFMLRRERKSRRPASIPGLGPGR
jgi:protein SCO1/2